VTDSRKTVLIVEDTNLCAIMLEIALAQIGWLSIRIVTSAEEARAVLDRDGDVCAVITDVHLPDASGFDLIQWVRSRAASARLPILVISGDSDPNTNTTVLRLGADAYFPKPFSPYEVRQKLEDLIDGGPESSPLH
jgi:DNA-binding response OmpR family regulator